MIPNTIQDLAHLPVKPSHHAYGIQGTNVEEYLRQFLLCRLHILCLDLGCDGKFAVALRDAGLIKVNFDGGPVPVVEITSLIRQIISNWHLPNEPIPLKSNGPTNPLP